MPQVALLKLPIATREHLDAIGFDSEAMAMTTPWLLSLFVERLPAASVLRVWDFMIVLQQASCVPSARAYRSLQAKALLRAGVALILTSNKDMLDFDDPIALASHIQNGLGVGHNHERLVRSFYASVGALPSRWINRIRHHFNRELVCHGLRGSEARNLAFLTLGTLNDAMNTKY